MLKGFIVLFTLLISYFMFKRKFTNSQYLGVVFVISGLLVVGSSNIKSYNSKCINIYIYIITCII